MVVVLGGGSLPANAVPVTAASGTSKALREMSFRALQQAAVASAVSAAQATGEPVQVEGMITPTEQTLALPDGTMQYEASTLPVRVEQGGTWVPVDTTLGRVGDWLEPAASVAPVRFSRGGSDQLAQVQTETGEWVTERWPYGSLPAPTVAGDTATYTEVLPGVDLKMIATVTGQTSVYVVKNEKAAQSTRLNDLHVLIEGADLTKGANGAVEAEAADGSQLVAGAPLWWDSSNGGTYRVPGGDDPALPVAHEIGADRVALDVGASVDKEEKRSSDEVTYPIYVDPDWSSGQSASWYTDAQFPAEGNLNASTLRVGVSTPYASDMFFQFPIWQLAGKKVSNAVLSTTMTKVLWCAPDPIEIRPYGLSPSPGFSRNQQFAAGTSWGDVLHSQNPGNCGSPVTAVGWSVTGEIAKGVDAGASETRLGVTAAGARSRRWFSPAALLTVSYNSPPNVPTSPVFTSPSRQCGTAAAPAMIGQSDVTVQVNQTDPDPGNVDTNFHLMKASDLNTRIQDRASGLGVQGLKSVTFPGLTNGETYAWRGWGSDHFLNGVGPSEWCYFTVDTTKPAMPAVTAPAGASYVVGAGVPLSVTGASDVAGYVYWVTPTQLVAPVPPVPADGTVSVGAALPDCATTVTNSVRWACKASSGATTLTVAPTDSLSTVWVSAFDKAGNQSAATGHPLYPGGNTGTPAVPANLDAGHAWQLTAMSSPLPDAIPDANPWIGSAALDLMIPATASTTSTDLPDFPFTSPVLSTNVATAGYEITSLGAPVDASQSFTFSLWVKPAHIAPTTSQVVAIQSGPGVGTMQLQITSTGRYAFCLGDRYVNMSNTARDNNCVNGGTVTPGSWQMVTGIWDGTNQQLRFLIGNSMTPVAVNGHVNGSGDRSANGRLTFGPGPDSLRFIGLITNPVVVPGVINHAQLERLTAFELPFTD